MDWRRAWILPVAATLLALAANDAFAQLPSTAQAAAEVAAEKGVSPADVTVTGVQLVSTQRVGDRIITKYRIEYKIRGRSQPGALSATDDPEKKEVKQEMRSLIDELEYFYYVNDRFPTSADGLSELEVEDGGLVDPWGHPYQYEVEDAGLVRVISVGPDGQLGTTDDSNYETNSEEARILGAADPRALAFGPQGESVMWWISLAVVSSPGILLVFVVVMVVIRQFAAAAAPASETESTPESPTEPERSAAPTDKP